MSRYLMQLALVSELDWLDRGRSWIYKGCGRRKRIPDTIGAAPEEGNMTYTAEENKILDRIIENRRSVRAFRKDLIPTREMLEGVVHAGLWAPYAAIMVPPGVEFRKFVIVQHHSPAIAKIHALMREQTKAALDAMKDNFAEKPMPENLKAYVERMGMAVQSGFPGFEDAPSLVVVAEHKAFRQVELKSLPHVVENMWLKATCLGLGLQLMTVIELLSERKEFSEILGMPPNQYSYAGCIVGYPVNEPSPGQRPVDGTITRWI